MLLVAVGLPAQDSTGTQKLLASGRYVFEANMAIPQTGTSRQLSYGYSLIVKKDTLSCYLPYFGRAYSAPVDLSNTGIEFITNSFTYSAAPGKKGRTEISIVPKNITTDVQEINLTVYEDGNAALNISCNFRQAISFQGEILAIRERKKKKH
jgi:hypothetical protein